MANRLARRAARTKRSHQVARSAQVGEAEKIIPISRETAEIIAQQEKLFLEQFGREPGPDGPLFFEPSVVAVPQFLSDESTDDMTGRIVTHFLTDAELQEWNDAVDEYHQKVETGETQ